MGNIEYLAQQNGTKLLIQTRGAWPLLTYAQTCSHQMNYNQSRHIPFFLSNQSVHPSKYHQAWHKKRINSDDFHHNSQVPSSKFVEFLSFHLSFHYFYPQIPIWFWRCPVKTVPGVPTSLARSASDLFRAMRPWNPKAAMGKRGKSLG